jgi:hypothetical protein
MKQKNFSLNIILYILIGIFIVFLILKLKDGERFNMLNEPLTKQDAYNLFNLDRNASEDDIKKRWKNMSLEYHPDRNPNLLPEASFGIKDQRDIQYINKAKDLLLSPSTLDTSSKIKELLMKLQESITTNFYSNTLEILSLQNQLNSIQQLIKITNNDQILLLYKNILEYANIMFGLVNYLRDDRNIFYKNKLNITKMGNKRDCFEPFVIKDLDGLIEIEYKYDSHKCLKREYIIGGKCKQIECQYKAIGIKLSESALTSEGLSTLNKKYKERLALHGL